MRGEATRAVAVIGIEPESYEKIIRLSEKIVAGLRPDFADLALLALAERLKTDRILTLDQRDFAVYRLRNGKSLRNVLAGRPARS